jgi:carboxypeptidase Q
LKKLIALTTAVALAVSPAAYAAERIDYDMIGRIRTEGFRNSRVMEISRALTDKIGPRLTGSPNMKEANDWTLQQFQEWGLSNAHLEAWGPFGRGWSYDFASARMITPDVAQLYAIPKAWSPGTNGAIRAQAVRVKLSTKEDLEAQKGKLAGKIVLVGDMPDLKPIEKGFLERHDQASLDKLSNYPIPAARGDFNMADFARRRDFRKQYNQFLMDEKVAAIVEPGSGGDGGTFDVQQGGGFKADEPTGVTAVVMNPEHYARVARLLDAKENVELELDVRAQFHDHDGTQWNTIAEIPGTDKKGEIVMLGAHLDSWHAGTGATDNAAGSAAMMEAIRILKALDVKPRRTIRIGLWSGEEQGLLGSRAYVAKNFGEREEIKEGPEKDLPSWARTAVGALKTTPDYNKFSAYFNMDNGTGKIRGVYSQENYAATRIFEEWIEPLRDLGVTTVVTRNTGGTDHQSFDAIGLPGFQFIQDNVEYSTRTHHSNMDTYDRLQREDMMQAAVVIATFAYNAAMREERFPRKPLPKETAAAKKPATTTK